jgi:hypothetical protein
MVVFWSVLAVMVIGGTFIAVSKAKEEEAAAAESAPEGVESAPENGEEA